ncbi:MAG: FAD-dependent thymidylate synthase [Candidatus Marinimicrobia bacterium]|nr:FAD-dependent thymidylate synthase [Candidatus Neomarinimicrobiota bacterium]
MEKLRPNSERKFFADYIPQEFSPEQEKILNPFFSNLDGPIYVIHDLPETVAASLIARQSQTTFAPRELFIQEYLTDESLSLEWVRNRGELGLSQFVDIAKAEDLYNRIFVGWHHEQLAKLVDIFIGIEGVSQVGTKYMEDGRYVRPLERSTRYGRFHLVDARGRYRYAREPRIMASQYGQLYCETTDRLIEANAELIEEAIPLLRIKYPGWDGKQIRNRAFDLCRVLLPASILTNLGIVVNGLTAEYRSAKLQSSGLAEPQEIGRMIQEEVGKIYPSLMARFEDDFGKDMIRYQRETREGMELLTEEIIPAFEPIRGPRVELTDYDPEGEIKVIAEILWEYGDERPKEQIRESVRRMNWEEKVRIFDRYIGERKNLKQKPGRALEATSYNFVIRAPFEIFRDLDRHSVLTKYRHDFTFDHGWTMEKELAELNPEFERFVREETEKAMETFYLIREILPKEAQYMTTFGALTAWSVIGNFREFLYIPEFRTGEGRHPGYQRVAQMIYELIKEVHPILSRAYKFVDMGGEKEWVTSK